MQHASAQLPLLAKQTGTKQIIMINRLDGEPTADIDRDGDLSSTTDRAGDHRGHAARRSRAARANGIRINTFTLDATVTSRRSSSGLTEINCDASSTTP